MMMINWAHALSANSRSESAGSTEKLASWAVVRSGGPGPDPLRQRAGYNGL